MPYSAPNHPPDRPARSTQRRTRSAGTYFSDDRGPGAFASLGSLPRRTKPGGPPPMKKIPVFHFNEDDEDDQSNSNSYSDDDHDGKASVNFPPQRRDTFRLSLNTKNLSPSSESSPSDASPSAIPFPRSSPQSPPCPSHPPALPSARPPLPRTTSLLNSKSSITRTSSGILLSNGKPLKSSLKSSFSAPSIPESPRPIHLRAQSAPSAPSLVPKNVHFAEKESGLETVTVFSKSARPASLCTPDAGGDDTETETDSEIDRRHIRGGSYRESFPFPRMSPHTSSPLAGSPPPLFELDYTLPGATSPVPSPSPSPYANVHLESVSLAPSTSSARKTATLTGTVVVRNVAYEKQVAVRFTLDDWQTISEVSGRHVVSLPSIPSDLSPPPTISDAISAISSSARSKEPTAPWDRFAFSIRLDDYAHNLHERVLWLVVRFTSGRGLSQGGGEWWDNNGGQNYRVGFRVKNEFPSVVNGGERRNVSSAPTIPMNVTAQQRPQAFSSDTSSPPTAPAALPASSPISPQERRNSVLAATTNRLSKFSLMNYAAPSPSSRNMISQTSQQPQQQSPEVPKAPESAKDPNASFGREANDFANIQTHFIGGHPATVAPPGYGYEGHDDDVMLNSGRHQRVSPHWSWGWQPTSNTKSSPPSSSSDLQNQKTWSKPKMQAGDEYKHSRALVMSPTSMSTLREKSPSPSGSSGSPARSSSSSPAERTSPPPKKSPSPPRYSPPSSGASTALDSDSIYKAFVARWCFAQGPPPGVGIPASPGNGPVSVGATV